MAGMSIVLGCGSRSCSACALSSGKKKEKKKNLRLHEQRKIPNLESQIHDFYPSHFDPIFIRILPHAFPVPNFYPNTHGTRFIYYHINYKKSDCQNVMSMSI